MQCRSKEIRFQSASKETGDTMLEGVTTCEWEREKWCVNTLNSHVLATKRLGLVCRKRIDEFGAAGVTPSMRGDGIRK